MPVFAYRAADRRGQTVDGVMDAPDASAVIERLHREAYFPVKVTPQAERRAWRDLALSRGIRARDLLAFTQQLATLVEAGMPLDRALSILEELAPNPRVKAVVADLLHSVRGGSSLSDALAKHHPRPFSRLYINMVRAGEKGGVLEATLRRLAEFQEARQAFTEAIVSALIYPVVITTVGAGAIVFLMAFVIPRFATIFADMGQAIPLPTQILLATSLLARSYWWVGALAVFGIILGWRLWTGTAEGRLQWDRLLLRIPLVGALIIKVETARFARTFGTMLRSGVPVLGALAVVGDIMTNQIVGRAVHRLSDTVKRGGTIAAAMQEHTPFPALATHMVRVGEETGRLEDMLLKTADTVEAEVRSELRRLIGLLEPAIILAMGVVVAFIVVAMLLAIFSINEIPHVMRARQIARDQSGFTLVELLVVIIVLGLLVGLVGPRLWGQVGKSKQATARAQIELLGSALDQYRLDIGTYPGNLEDLQQKPGNAANWNGPYLKKAVPNDPWGFAYKYKCCPGQFGEYDLWSEGADGAPGGEGENADIVSWTVGQQPRQQ